jgi:hypothetical protein
MQAQQYAENEKRQRGQTRNQCQHEQQRGGSGECLGLGKYLPANITAEMAAFFFRGNARNKDARGGGNDQGRNLSNQTFADGQQGVRAQGREQIHSLHQHADGQAANDVGDEDDDARNGIALDEFHGTVHGAEELRFTGQHCAAAASLVGINVACPQFGIDGQLLAGHGVQGETCPDFRHAT